MTTGSKWEAVTIPPGYVIVVLTPEDHDQIAFALYAYEQDRGRYFEPEERERMTKLRQRFRA